MFAVYVSATQRRVFETIQFLCKGSNCNFFWELILEIEITLATYSTEKMQSQQKGEEGSVLILWLTYSPSDSAIECNFLLKSLFSSTTWRIVSSLYDRPSLCSAWSTGFTHFGENKITLIFDQKGFPSIFTKKTDGIGTANF